MARRLFRKKKVKAERGSEMQTRLINGEHWGLHEPTIPNGPLTGTKYSHALSWYSYMAKKRDAKEFILEYLEKSGQREILERMKRVPDRVINQSAAWRCRLLTRGAQLGAEALVAHDKAMREMLRHEGEIDDSPEETEESEGEKKPTIKDRVAEKFSDIVGELEGLIDDGFYDGFQLDAWYRSKNVTPQIAKRIADRFRPRLAEVQEALEKGADEQIREGYRSYDRDEIELLAEVFSWLIDDSDRFAQNLKAARAPRKKKPVSAEKKLRFLSESYLKFSKEFNIQSIDPTRILDAQELWTINVKYKLVTVFRAEDMGGKLDVARCKIAGFNKHTSATYRLGRRAEEHIKNIASMARAQLKKYALENLKIVSTLQERINENTVLARVF